MQPSGTRTRFLLMVGCAALCAAAVTFEVVQRTTQPLVHSGQKLQIDVREPISKEGVLDWSVVTLFGEGVALEGDRVAFYSHSGISFVSPRAGDLVLSVVGVGADGIWPALDVEIGENGLRREVMTDARQKMMLGRVEAGQQVVLQFANDGVGADGADRNLWIDQIQVN